MGFPAVKASRGEGRVETRCGEGVGMWGSARPPPSAAPLLGRLSLKLKEAVTIVRTPNPKLET